MPQNNFHSIFRAMGTPSDQRTLGIANYKTIMQQYGYSEPIAETILNCLDYERAYNNWVFLHDFLTDIHAAFYQSMPIQDEVQFYPTEEQALKIARVLKRENIMRYISMLPLYPETFKANNLNVNMVLNLIAFGDIDHNIKLFFANLDLREIGFNLSDLSLVVTRPDGAAILELFRAHKTEFLTWRISSTYFLAFIDKPHFKERFEAIIRSLHELGPLLFNLHLIKIMQQPHFEEILQFFVEHKAQLNPFLIDRLIDASYHNGLVEMRNVYSSLVNVNIDHLAVNHSLTSVADTLINQNNSRMESRMKETTINQQATQLLQVMKKRRQDENEVYIQQILEILRKFGSLIDVEKADIKVELQGLKELLRISPSQRKMCGVIAQRKVTTDNGYESDGYGVVRLSADLFANYLTYTDAYNNYLRQAIQILMQPGAAQFLKNKVNRIKATQAAGEELLQIPRAIRNSLGLPVSFNHHNLHYYFTIYDPLKTEYKKQLGMQITDSNSADANHTSTTTTTTTSTPLSFAETEGLFALDVLNVPILYLDPAANANAEANTNAITNTDEIEKLFDFAKSSPSR